MVRKFSAAWRELGPAAPLAVGVTTMPPVGGIVLLALIPTIEPYLHLYPVAGSLGFIVVSAALIGMALVPTVSTSILAGWAFGATWGFTVGIVALTLAGLLAYGAARLAARDRVIGFVRSRPGWNAVYQTLLNQSAARTALVIVLLRLPPLAPMALGNYLLGTLRVPLRIYVPATVLGMAPRTFALVFAASQLQQLSFEDVDHPAMRIVGIVVSISSMVLLGLLARRGLQRATRDSGQALERGQRGSTAGRTPP